MDTKGLANKAMASDIFFIYYYPLRNQKKYGLWFITTTDCNAAKVLSKYNLTLLLGHVYLASRLFFDVTM
jgi:hypothetical protein